MTDMSPAEAVFFACLEKKTPAEQLAYLDQACTGQPELRAMVEKLLAAHPKVGVFLESKPGSANTDFFAAQRKPAPLQPIEKEGTIVAGRYKLLQQIGEGGMGSVWMADQTEPVKRRVAIKLIRIDRGNTKMILSRFEAERQASALMDHPHIARLLDAGTTDLGQPYFVMELVKGIPLTDYCDTHKLSISERLGLFQQICSAVQHAHQKGIIHRDLKPTNILVESHDGKPVPKVIDFGLAKATSGMQLTEHTLFTAFGNVMGTPTYMAPEQATFNAVDVDTRADVYSLGVILYELLTGTTPITRETVKKAAIDEMLKLVREQEAPKPSSRLSTAGTTASIAANRNIDAGKLSKLLRGDLDWVVLKALEKDRKRRYETANGLASDIQRHLSNEPVLARPPSALYRLQKAWQRNKLAFAAGTAIAASLLIGIAASLWQAVRADAEAARAKEAEQRAVTVLDELRATAPAFAEQARGLAAMEKFDEAIEKLDYALKLRPDAAEFLVAKADLLQCQLKLAEAAKLYREALRVKPGLARAEASAKICAELLQAPTSADGKLSRESLARLHLSMQQQQRPAAELMPVARLLGEEKKLVVEYWLVRLKDLPVSAEKPLKDRLTVREDGRLAIDLSGTKVTDLSPLAGAPLAELNLWGAAELTDLAPLRGIGLVELNISKTCVADLSPLREMHTLEMLKMTGSKARDLGPLRALRLKNLTFDECDVSDLNPIHNMPLEEVNMRLTRVTDLSALIGMPIKSIDLTWTGVLDFSPLAQLPLEECYLQHSRIRDLTVLRGRPLKELVLWGSEQARNYAVLAEIKSLELLMLPYGYRNLPPEEYAAIGALRDHPKLRQLGADSDGLAYASTGSKDIFWRNWDDEQALVLALRAVSKAPKLHRLSDGSWKVAFEDSSIRDLKPLSGAPISQLSLSESAVTDLSPLRGMPLKNLSIWNTKVIDLTPLKGMAIEELDLSGTEVADLTPLRGMPLTWLSLDRCGDVTDLSPLADCTTLTRLHLPPYARHIEFLRSFPKLREISSKTAAEFWQDYDKQAWARALRESGLKIKTLKGHLDGTWEVDLSESGISDLTILHGAPIGNLFLWNTPVADLTPLRGMALKWLSLFGTKVTDLGPLKGMPLENVTVSGTKVADISALRGMPLRSLRLHNCAELTDLSPLTECKELEELTLPPNAKNIDSLRALPKLERIGLREDANDRYRPNQTAAEFWKDYDEQ